MERQLILAVLVVIVTNVTLSLLTNPVSAVLISYGFFAGLLFLADYRENYLQLGVCTLSIAIGLATAIPI